MDVSFVHGDPIWLKPFWLKGLTLEFSVVFSAHLDGTGRPGLATCRVPGSGHARTTYCGRLASTGRSSKFPVPFGGPRNRSGRPLE